MTENKPFLEDVNGFEDNNQKNDRERNKKVTITIPDDSISNGSDIHLHKDEARDEAGPLPDSQQLAKRTLRRNSISLPDLNTPLMQALKQMYGEEEPPENNESVDDVNDINEVSDQQCKNDPPLKRSS